MPNGGKGDALVEEFCAVHGLKAAAAGYSRLQAVAPLILQGKLPTIDLQEKRMVNPTGAEHLAGRLHSESRKNPPCGKCLLCDPGPSDFEGETWWDPLTEKNIPFRMARDAALSNIKHSSKTPFCLARESRTAALIGKEGGISWLDGRNAAKNSMRVSVCHLSAVCIAASLAPMRLQLQLDSAAHVHAYFIEC
jgi:hypothetical protein